MKKQFNGVQALNKAFKVRNKNVKNDIRHNAEYRIYFRNIKNKPQPHGPVLKRK